MITIESILNQGFDLDSIKTIRQDVIDKGKKHYSSQEHLLRSARAVSVDDAIFLHKVTSVINPKIVIEIGTWFGTSASIIQKSCDCTVYTCDVNNVYSAVNDKIFFYNLQSDAFIPKMINHKVVGDMCFIDANLRKGDAEKLVKLIPNGFFVVHDFVDGEKGFRAVNYLLGTKIKFDVISHNGVAIMGYA